MMSVFSRAGAGIQNILSEWRQPASRSSLCVGSFLFGHESGHSIARPIALRATGSHPSGRSSEKLPTHLSDIHIKYDKRGHPDRCIV